MINQCRSTVYRADDTLGDT